MWTADGKPLDEYLSLDVDAYEGDIDALLKHRQEQLKKWIATGRQDRRSQEIVRGIRSDIRKTKALQSKTLIKMDTAA